MNRLKRNAVITGYGFILMTVISGFAVGYAFPKFPDKSHLDMLQNLLIENLGFVSSCRNS